MKINQRGLDVIKSFEGCKLSAYLCPAKVWTIGYGHTGADVKQGMNISLTQADDLLKKDLAKFEDGVTKLVTNVINENQFSALVSFAYNCGLGNLKSSTLLRKLNINPQDITIKNEFAKWNKAAGRELAGLTRRRKVESELYFM